MKNQILYNFKKNAFSVFLSTIGIYNKPNIENRYETVTILLLNTWELVFKDVFVDKNNVIEVKNSLDTILFNKKSISIISMAKNDWLESSIEDTTISILEFVTSLELVEV